MIVYHTAAREVVKSGLELLFPTECLICHQEGSSLCRSCFALLQPRRLARCLVCERLVRRGLRCPKHRTSLLCFEAFHFSPSLRLLVHALKYEGHRELVPIFVEQLIASLREARLPKTAIVVPVPLHRKRENERGFNQARLLAQPLAAGLGWRYQELLVRRKETKPQVGLSGSERRTNLGGAFRLARPLGERERTFLIVDDVATTGSTLNECAKVLRRGGARLVYAAVLARG